MWLAVSLTALLSVAALTLDVGQVLVGHVQMQKACDAAALAAATTTGDPATTAAQYYADNAGAGGSTAATPVLQSSATGSWTYSVGGDTLTITNPYSDAFTTGRGYTPTHLYDVAAVRQVPASFGNLLGPSTRTVRAHAVGWRYHVSKPVPAVFSHRTDISPYGTKWAGGGGIIEGDVVANTSADFSGADDIVHGSVYYGTDCAVNGTDQDADGYFQMAGPADWPFSMSLDPFQPYTYVVDGDYHLTTDDSTIPPGVYYVTGDVVIDGSDIAGGGITFIAEGDITVSGANHEFTAARDGVLFYSLATSTGGTAAININSSGGCYTGTCLAPNGQISYSGAGNQVMRGSLVADRVSITGTDYTLYPTGQTGAAKVEGKLVE